MIDPFTSVMIRGRDASGNWYQIEFAQAKTGFGWVTSQYITVQSQQPIPVVASGSGSGPSGVITQQVNVRGGPGTDSSSLGILNARDVVTLTGRDPGGLWLQIQYGPQPQGRGWVAAGYVQSDSLNQLPIVGGVGQVIGTPTPTSVPATAVPTIGVARADNDSAQSPGADITFSPTGIGSFIYSSDLSVPEGDPADWIRLTSFGSRVSVRLECEGNGVAQMTITPTSATLTDEDLPTCGQARNLALAAGHAYELRLSLSAGQGGQSYVRYTLTIDSLP